MFPYKARGHSPPHQSLGTTPHPLSVICFWKFKYISYTENLQYSNVQQNSMLHFIFQIEHSFAGEILTIFKSSLEQSLGPNELPNQLMSYDRTTNIQTEITTLYKNIHP